MMSKKIYTLMVCMLLLVGAGLVSAGDYKFQNASETDLVVIHGDTGNLDVLGNVTASWFDGIFNWIVGPSSTNYLSFNGTQLDFSESALNATIDSRIDFAEPGLNVNSSDYWDGYDTPAEITAGNSELLDEYDSTFFMPLNTSVYGDFDFLSTMKLEDLKTLVFRLLEVLKYIKHHPAKFLDFTQLPGLREMIKNKLGLNISYNTLKRFILSLIIAWESIIPISKFISLPRPLCSWHTSGGGSNENSVNG